MKFLLIATVVLLAVHSSYPARALSEPQRQMLKAELRYLLARSALDDNVINFLNTNVRQIMKEGLPSMNIPVLDPLTVEHLDLDLALDEITIKGAIDGVTVTGISTFVVDQIKINILSLSVGFAIHLDEISVTGTHYDIDGELGGLIPIYGEGAFSVDVKGLNISGTIALGTNNTFLYVKSLDLDADLQGINANFEGLLGGGDLGDMANQIVNDMVPQVFQNAKASLLPTLSQEVINLANTQLLVNVTLTDLLGLVSG